MGRIFASRLGLIILIGVLCITSVYFGLKARNLAADLYAAESEIAAYNMNEKVLSFTRMFVEKVLQSDSEVDFETRLTLENAVRDIKDPQILSEWNKFVQSKTEAEAEREVKILLGLLMSKIQ